MPIYYPIHFEEPPVLFTHPNTIYRALSFDPDDYDTSNGIACHFFP